MNGMSLFSFDFSGSGKSAGPYCSLGWFEQDDLECVIQYLVNTGKVSTIGVWGRSMGAITALLYARRDPRITCMVLDSPFTSFKQLVKELAKQKVSLPGFISVAAFSVLKRSIKTRANFDIEQIDPIAHVPHIQTPALFGAANGDDFVLPSHSQELHDAHPGQKKLVIFQGDHNSERPLTFLFQVAEFLKSHMLPQESALATPKSQEQKLGAAQQNPNRELSSNVASTMNSSDSTSQTNENKVRKKVLQEFEASTHERKPLQIGETRSNRRDRSQIHQKSSAQDSGASDSLNLGALHLTHSKSSILPASAEREVKSKRLRPREQESKSTETIDMENSPNDPSITPDKCKPLSDGLQISISQLSTNEPGSEIHSAYTSQAPDSPSFVLSTGENNYTRNNIKHVTVSNSQDMQKQPPQRSNGPRRNTIFGQKEPQTLNANYLLSHQGTRLSGLSARHNSVLLNPSKGPVRTDNKIFQESKIASTPHTIDLSSERTPSNATERSDSNSSQCDENFPPSWHDNSQVVVNFHSKPLNQPNIERHHSQPQPQAPNHSSSHQSNPMKMLRENLNPYSQVHKGADARKHFGTDQKPKLPLQQIQNNTSFSDFSRQQATDSQTPAYMNDCKLSLESTYSSVRSRTGVSQENPQQYVNPLKSNVTKQAVRSSGEKAFTPISHQHSVPKQPLQHLQHKTPSMEPHSGKSDGIQTVDFLSYYSVYAHQQGIKGKDVEVKDSFSALALKLDEIDRSLNDFNATSLGFSNKKERSFGKEL